MSDLKKAAQNQSQEIDDLRDFKNKAETGKYKEGCKNDFKNIYKDQDQNLIVLEQVLDKYKPENTVQSPYRRRDKPKDTAEQYYDGILENNEYLKDYIKKLKQRIDDLHN